MTTIALKDDIIAADTQLTMDDVKILSSDKILILNNDTILAAAGDVSTIHIAEKYFRQSDWEEKEKPNLLEKDKEGEYEQTLDAILIFKGKPYLVDRFLIPDAIKHPYIAVGSGWKFAMAAMHSGMSAVAAVEFASEFDVYTNNKVRWLNVKEFQENSKTRSNGRGKKRTSRMEAEEKGS